MNRTWFALLLGGLCGLCVQSAAEDSAAFHVNDRDGHVLYVDASGIEQRDGLVYFWVKKMKAGEGKPFVATAGEQVVAFRANPLVSREHRIANCARHTMATLNTIYYEPTGEMTGSMSYPEPVFRPVPPQTTGASLLNYVCGRYGKNPRE